MSRYAIKFNKTGYIKYTSHLDLLRLFKRVMKRSGIKLKYSQGFNPHPKMSFAQPLSLGYESIGEILEIETAENLKCDEIKEKAGSIMPSGIEITDVVKLPDTGKTLASLCYEAEYLIAIPAGDDFTSDINSIISRYLDQDNIYVLKKQKKTKEMKKTDIKGKIRLMSGILVNNNIIMTLICDSGSDSNLSPELVISSFIQFAGIECDRSAVEVMRKKLLFKGYDI